MTPEEVVDYLRLERVRQRVYQREIAEVVGVTQPQVSQWEMGVWTPKVENLFAWADALGLEFELVRRGEGSEGDTDW